MKPVPAFLFLIFSLPVWGQNLLMNGNFEEENICTEFIKNCAPEGWISTSLKSDYYFDDGQHAWEGQHFVGMIAITSLPRSRNYLRSRLLCGLRAGAQYQLRFHIRSVHPVLDSVGIYFSADDILYRKEGMKNAQPQLWVRDGLSGKQTEEWQEVSLVYVAGGTENFICIGDFKRNSYRLTGRPDLGRDFYFFMDDISLVPLNKNEKLCPSADSIRQEEYEMNARHALLEKMVYLYKKNPPVVETPRTVIQRIDTLVIPDVLFATNSFILNADANRLLDSFARSSAGLKIDSLVVEGHTDSTGTIAANRQLSLNRAGSVTNYLQQFFHTVIRTRGWASERPVGDNRTREGRRKNRRVEIYLYIRE